MKTILIILLCCAVTRAAFPPGPAKECSCPGPYLYVICITGVSMIIMFFIIVFLIMRMRSKNSENYNALVSRNSLMITASEVKLETKDNSGITRETSNEQVNNLTCEKCTVMKVNAVTQTIPVSTEIDTLTKNTNTARAVGIKLPVIRPEEMKKICQDVLMKCKYAKSESIAEFNEIKDDKLDVPITDDRKKSLSASVLDIYDVLPPSAHKRSLSTESEIYDELTSKPNEVMVDLDTNYLLPFGKDSSHNTYVNANEVTVRDVSN